MSRNKSTGEKRRLDGIPFFLILAGLLALLVFSVLASIAFGNADLSLKEVWSVVAYELFHVKKLEAYGSGAVHDVVWLIRFPRAILALSVGMGLAVCGGVMQAVVRNSLADPYVLGISSGATLGATLAIMLGIGRIFGSNSVGILAFLGAMAASFLVLLIANIGGRPGAGKLILSGMAVSAVCSAFSGFVLYIANDKGALQSVTYWTMGSLAGAGWENVSVIFPVILTGCLLFLTQYRKLNLMLYGDETAIVLGTDLRRVRLYYMILVSVIVGFAVYAAGMIGFVGLIIPHAARILAGTDHSRMLPLCALGGAVFLIWCDVLCRILLTNSEMPIGILVSLVGAPCFIWLMIRKSTRFGGME